MSTVKSEKAVESGFFADLFQTGLYKRSQGRIARQLTFAALALGVAVGCWALATTLETYDWAKNLAERYGTSADILSSVAGLVLFVPLVWICYRVVNVPRFADFLIGVEAEMNKVSWPSKSELIRASLVVLFTIFLLSAVLFTFDLVWSAIFTWLGISGGAGTSGAG